MAISYVGGVAGGRAGNTVTTTQSINGTLTGGSNSSPSAGDIVVIWCSSGADTSAAPNQTVSGNTSGTYNTETQQSQLGTTYDSYAQLNWMVQGSTPDTTITIPSSGSIRNAQRWAIHVFRGVNQTTPWDVTSTTASGTASGRPNPPSITPSTAGAWILWLGHSSAATGTAYTAPTGFSTNWLGNTTADTADDMDGFGYYTGWTSGAYDPAAISAGGTTNAADSWVAMTAVLKPAANNYTLTAQGGSYSKTGSSASILRSKSITASGGSYALTGASAGVNRNRVLTTSGGSYSLTGSSADITYTASSINAKVSWVQLELPEATTSNSYVLTASGGAYTITGASVSIYRNKSILATGGTYSLTGQSAIVLRSKRLGALGGSYIYTGQQVNITYGALSNNYQLTAQGGSYSLTGANANVTKSKLLIAGGGTYTLTGADALLVRGRVLIANGGSYSVTGGSANISWSAGAIQYTLICQGGSYTLLGSSVNLSKSKKLIADGGYYTLTGSSVDIHKSKKIFASGGSYTNNGASATILKSKVLVGSGGSYVYSGQSAALTRSRLLQAVGGVYNLTGASVTITRTISGGYPDPADVLYGVMYGPTNTEYTGTLDIGKKFRIDIATGNIVMIIDTDKVMSL